MTWSRRVDLPEPETPDKQTKRPRGSWTSRLRRLCLVAFLKWSQVVASERGEGDGGVASLLGADSTGRRVVGTGMVSRPEK